MKGKKLDSFINSLNLTGRSLDLAKILLKTVDDCKEFCFNYYGRSYDTYSDLLNFRKHKVSNDFVSYKEFLKIYKGGEVDKKIINKIFVQPVNNVELKLINEAILLKRTTLDRIYYNFCINPDDNILKHVL